MLPLFVILVFLQYKGMGRSGTLTAVGAAHAHPNSIVPPKGPTMHQTTPSTIEPHLSRILLFGGEGGWTFLITSTFDNL